MRVLPPKWPPPQGPGSGAPHLRDSDGIVLMTFGLGLAQQVLGKQHYKRHGDTGDHQLSYPFKVLHHTTRLLLANAGHCGHAILS
jgi:hypothetical protein